MQDEQFDANGNTIIYDQWIEFSTTSGTLEKTQAGDLLLFQLTDVAKKNEYLEMLKEGHPDFQSVTEVNPVESRSTDSGDSDGLDLLWIILIAVGGAILCCCCCALFFAWLNTRDRQQQDEDYSHGDEADPDAPEGPVYDHSEKSGEEIFSNESEHKTVPYGQDEEFQSTLGPTMDESIDESHDASESNSSRGLD